MINEILKFNKEFVANKGYEKFVTNKYPDKKIAILSCMDTRLTELLPAALGVKNGDVKMIKNAGGIISHPFGSVIRSLLVAIFELGVTDVMVVAHSDCGACHMSAQQTIDIMDSRYWGLMGSNYCKDMLLKDCKISRFDAHCGVHNVTMQDCIFGHQKLQVIGFGEFLIERCKCHGSVFMLLRGDYGSFFNGNVTVRDCEWEILPYDPYGYLIASGNKGTHDFGYPCMLPSNVHIENVLIDDSKASADNKGTFVFNNYDTYDEEFEKGKPFPYGLPEMVTLKNVRTTSGKPVIHFQDERLFPGVKVIAED